MGRARIMPGAEGVLTQRGTNGDQSKTFSSEAAGFLSVAEIAEKLSLRYTFSSLWSDCLKAFLKPRSASPIDFPISGSVLGPNRTRTIMKMTSSSGRPISPSIAIDLSAVRGTSCCLGAAPRRERSCSVPCFPPPFYSQTRLVSACD